MLTCMSSFHLQTWQQRNTLNLKTSPMKNLKLQKSPNPKENRTVKGQQSNVNEQKIGENRQVGRENYKPPGKGEVQKGRQPIQIPGVNSNSQQKAEERKKGMKSPDSFPDDASFVAKINERVRNEEVEKEDLDEFEHLENCADNMSFCSQSSFVTKILQKDKVKQESLKLQQVIFNYEQRVMLVKQKVREILPYVKMSTYTVLFFNCCNASLHSILVQLNLILLDSRCHGDVNFH